MFFFGATGSILPYIISLLVLWSGLALNYGHLIPLPSKENNKQETLSEKEFEDSQILHLFDVDYNENVSDDVPDSSFILAIDRYLHFLELFPNYFVDPISSYKFSYATKYPTRGPPFLS